MPSQPSPDTKQLVHKNIMPNFPGVSLRKASVSNRMCLNLTWSPFLTILLLLLRSLPPQTPAQLIQAGNLFPPEQIIPTSHQVPLILVSKCLLNCPYFSFPLPLPSLSRDASQFRSSTWSSAGIPAFVLTLYHRHPQFPFSARSQRDSEKM